MPRETISHHRYADRVLVEVVIDDGNGDVSTRSIELDFGDDERVLVPRGDLPEEHERSIREHLERSNYRLRSHVSA